MDNEKNNQNVENNAAGGGNSPANEKTFTQEELNSIIADRLAQERRKYEGFEEIKAKASKYDELEKSKKSDIQKVQEQLDSVKKERDTLIQERDVAKIRATVAEELGVPAKLITANTEEAAREQAQAILDFSVGRKGGDYHYKGDSGESEPPMVDFDKIGEIKDPRARVRAYAKALENGASRDSLLKK